jgi:hypothetical protein
VAREVGKEDGAGQRRVKEAEICNKGCRTVGNISLFVGAASCSVMVVCTLRNDMIYERVCGGGKKRRERGEK